MLALCVADRYVCVWNRSCSEALGIRLSSLILSGQQRPVTVSSVLMVKRTFCPHHLPGSLHSRAGAQEQGKVGHIGAGADPQLPPSGRRSQEVFQTSLEEPDYYSAAYFCCAARHMWECIKAMPAHIHASFTHRGSTGSRKKPCSCAVPTWPQGNDSML